MSRLPAVCLLLLAAPAAAAPIDYVRQVKPILAAHCVRCHGPERQKAELRLDTAAAILRGGNVGPAIVPGKASASVLVHALRGTGDTAKMPPKGAGPTPEEVALIAAWVDEGAKAPADEAAQAAGPRKADHWSFQPVRRPELPATRNSNWARNPIDRFVLARLEKAGVAPSPEADRATLARRLSLDLLGLPPAPADVDAFVRDTRPDATERYVDTLLASPHYGERQARFWLDQARYADSNGFNIDAPRSIWPYRDWVIQAFNKDLPFDRFTVEQLAGDLLPDAGLSQQVATGFHRNTLLNQEGGIDVEQFRVESVVDRVNTTGAVWLGLTAGCAQCHDHKFDPLTQREYYQFLAFFNSCDEPTIELLEPAERERVAKLRARVAVAEKRLRALDPTTPKRVEQWERDAERLKLTPGLPKAVRDVFAVAINGRDDQQTGLLTQAVRDLDRVRNLAGGLGDPLPLAGLLHLRLLEDRARLETELTTLKAGLPPVATTLVMKERDTPRDTHVMLGGDFLRKGVKVAPGTPAGLPPLPAKPARGERYTRLDLARWLVDPAHPLTARVTVNRFWQQHFGVGLVETENDFGTQGTPPTHPELLDWLASEFVRNGWSVKDLHRLIVTSATYRQSSRARPDLATLDPRNLLLARMPRPRLEAEAVRDSALSASGLLSRKVGGPSVFPPQPEGVSQFTQIRRAWVPSPGADRYRRGLYTHFWRSAPHPGLMVFDAPDSTTACTRRNRSNTPLQALTLLNDAAFQECAVALAGRTLRECDGDDADRLAHAFRLCLARVPSPGEAERLTRFLKAQREAFAADPVGAGKLVPADRPAGISETEGAAWSAVGRVLLNLDEFIVRE